MVSAGGVLADMVSFPTNPEGYQRVDMAQLVPIVAAQVMALEKRLDALESRQRSS